jgi:hypothetical protein
MLNLSHSHIPMGFGNVKCGSSGLIFSSSQLCIFVETTCLDTRRRPKRRNVRLRQYSEDSHPSTLASCSLAVHSGYRKAVLSDTLLRKFEHGPVVEFFSCFIVYFYIFYAVTDFFRIDRETQLEFRHFLGDRQQGFVLNDPIDEFHDHLFTGVSTFIKRVLIYKSRRALSF